MAELTTKSEFIYVKSFKGLVPALQSIIRWYKIDCKGLYYKTFNGRNLQICVISWSAFPV